MAVFFENRSTTVSVALRPADAFAGADLLGMVQVSLAGVDRKPIVTAEGYVLFLDLPDGDYTVEVAAEFYDYYEALVVNPASLDPLNVVPVLNLQPNTNYPFPAGATLVSGVVTDQNDAPVAGADVQVQGRSEFAQTDALGRYVLHFDLTEAESVTIDVSRAGYQAQSDIVFVQPGQTVAHDVEIALLSEPATAILIGTITDNFGDPVTQAVVASAAYGKNDKTDLAGQSVLALVLGSASENVDLTVDQTGFTQGTVQVAANQGATTNFNLALATNFTATTARLRIRTKDASGDLPGVLVEVIEKGRVAVSSTSDSRARFYFDDLLTLKEDVTVRVSKAGYVTQTSVREIEQDKEKSYDITLTAI